MKFFNALFALVFLTVAPITLGQQESELACEDFRVTPEAAARFPDLKGACEAIVERDGELYGKFSARVRQASGSSVTLYLPATDHTFRITPEASTRVLLDGRKTRVGQLQRGQDIRIYLAVSEFAKPDIEQVVVISDTDVLVATPVQPAPQLPKTASSLPMIALVGLICLAIAGLVRRLRLRAASTQLLCLGMLTLVLSGGISDAYADSHVSVKPGRMLTSMIRTAAIVEAVDHETGELKLIDASGRRFTTRVDAGVVDLDQIEPRDRIVMEYLDSVAILVTPHGAPEAGQGAAVEVSTEGHKPALAAAETYMVKATVLKLNLSERRATLQYEDGSVDTIKVAQRVPLDLVKVGDEVRFRVTHAVAVSVRKADDL